MPQASLLDLVDAMCDQIRDAMDAATAGTDLRIQVEPGRIVNPTPPTIDVFAADDFRGTEGASMGQMSGLYRFIVRARIDTGDYDASQDILWEMMDDLSAFSVAAALADDERLGGLADDLSIETHSGHRQYVDTTESGAYLGVEWTVAVLRAYS